MTNPPQAPEEPRGALAEARSALTWAATDGEHLVEALRALRAGALEAPQDAEFRGDVKAFSRRLHHLLALAGTHSMGLLDLFPPASADKGPPADARALAVHALTMLGHVLTTEHAFAILTERDRRFFEAGEMVGRWNRAEAAEGGVLQPRKKREGQAKGNANSKATRATKAGARAEGFYPFYDRKDAALSRNARIMSALKDMAKAGLPTCDPETCRRWLRNRSLRA